MHTPIRGRQPTSAHRKTSALESSGLAEPFPRDLNPSRNNRVAAPRSCDRSPNRARNTTKHSVFLPRHHAHRDDADAWLTVTE